jgi:hypothetical protein
MHGKGAQNFPHSVDRSIETAIKVHKGVGRPKPLLQLLAGNQIAGMLQQDDQD